jgi:glutaminyl-tRNA synthetase
VGDKWCIYPTYDFTHCIVDSLEDITHSLCTLEFENRKASYYWLLHALDLYCPPQIEFSRLNVSGYAMSKRKLTLMVDQRIVHGWDDPRMPTIEGLRRRGYTPEGINNFCERVGITRASNMISHALLEECVRMDLDKKAPRAMAVLHPLKVTITNFGEAKTIAVPDFPAEPDSKTHGVPISKVIYIEREDFSEEHHKDFYRLTPSQNVGLKYVADGNIAFRKAIRDAKGQLTEIEVEIVSKEKVKSHIQWVSSLSPSEKPKTITVNMYDSLFIVDDIAAVPNFLDALNPKSLEVLTAFVDPSLFEVTGNHVQFERLGYFFRDPESTATRPLWNCTVNLKQDKSKK